MGRNLLELLENIDIGIDYCDTKEFSAHSLRKFLEGWRCQEGEGNKKSRRLCIHNGQRPIK